MSYRPARRGGAGMEILEVAPLTVVLIAINVIAYYLQTRNALGRRGYEQRHERRHAASGRARSRALRAVGPDGGLGEWWRLVTSGFLHASLIDIGSNMLALFIRPPRSNPRSDRCGWG